MKQLLTGFFLVAVIIDSFAQVPEKMSYQAVIRNNNNHLVVSHSIGMKISILQGISTGSVVYEETYDPNPVTNANGLVTVEIGGGIPNIGTFSDIDWSEGPYFIMTETDPTGGTNYTITGTSQILSVPFALYAKNAGNGFSGDYNDLTNLPELFDGTWDSLAGKPTTLTGYGITDAASKNNVDSVQQELEDLEYLVRQLPPPKYGMVAYYPFNGNANDESGNGYNGSISGATLTNDRFGMTKKAYSFSAANKNHITLNSAIGNFGLSNFTISVWVKRNSASGYEIFTQRSTPYRTSSWWELGWGSFSINENLAYQSNININVDDTLRNGVWYHFLGVREANTIRFYLNGALVAENTTAQVLNIDSQTKTEIGCHFFESPLECFNGIIDDVRLYNRALSENEIQMIYNEGNFAETRIGNQNDNTYNKVDWEGKVMTVYGLIPADSMGVTLPHEHLITVHQYNWWDLTNEELVIEDLQYYISGGGRTVVDATNIGIGRNPEAEKRISKATGLNVIMGTGCYKEPWIHDSLKSKSVDELAEIFINEIKTGINGIHAGLIGEVGVSRPITAFEEKSLRASARAQIATGAAIDVHFDINGPIEERQNAVDILESEGADLSRVYISHCTVYDELVEDYITLAQRGCYLSFDNLGMEVSSIMAGHYPTPLEPVETILALIDAGYLDKILISQDICFSFLLVSTGGYGYGHIVNTLVPQFLAGGITPEQIHTIMVDNPKRILAFKNYNDI